MSRFYPFLVLTLKLLLTFYFHNTDANLGVCLLCFPSTNMGEGDEANQQDR